MKNFAEPPDPLIGACLVAAATLAPTVVVGDVDKVARELYAAATAKPWERGDDSRAAKP